VSESAMQAQLLSSKPIPPEERLIVALDVPDAAAARRLVTALGEAVRFYKVGLELFAAGDGFELIDWLVERDKKVFADLKLYDIPETVRRAVRALRRRPISFLTVHASDGIVAVACAEKGEIKVLAVTVLTSFDSSDFSDLGVEVDVAALVLARARRAWQLGCDGVIASGREARQLRERLGESPLIVTPGIRPAASPAGAQPAGVQTAGAQSAGAQPAARQPPAGDDQKRVATVEEAFQAGADYVVVGRPIRDAADPRQAALDLQGRITGLFL
jgi:orotidine-5'-phosphate decarboxylase